MTGSNRTFFCGYAWLDQRPAATMRDSEAIARSITESIEKILRAI